jgi:hypothetical protein
VGEPETDRVAGHQGLERVRVLRIIARLNIGGPALHTTLLTERLDPRRYDARLIAGTEGPDEGNYLRLHGATPEGVTILRNARPPGPPDWHGCRSPCTPTTDTSSTATFRRDARECSWRWSGPGDDGPTCLLAVSDTVRAELLSLGVGSPARFRVMPLGLDLERYVSADAARGVLRSELGLAPDVPW